MYTYPSEMRLDLYIYEAMPSGGATQKRTRLIGLRLYFLGALITRTEVPLKGL